MEISFTWLMVWLPHSPHQGSSHDSRRLCCWRFFKPSSEPDQKDITEEFDEPFLGQITKVVQQLHGCKSVSKTVSYANISTASIKDDCTTHKRSIDFHSITKALTQRSFQIIRYHNKCLVSYAFVKLVSVKYHLLELRKIFTRCKVLE